MTMNPMDFINLLKGRNPQELVMSMVKNNNINDPMILKLIEDLIARILCLQVVSIML